LGTGRLARRNPETAWFRTRCHLPQRVGVPTLDDLDTSRSKPGRPPQAPKVSAAREINARKDAGGAPTLPGAADLQVYTDLVRACDCDESGSMSLAVSSLRAFLLSKGLILFPLAMWTIALATPTRADEHALLKGDAGLLEDLALHDNIRCADTPCWSHEISARASLGLRVRDGNARGGDCLSRLGHLTPTGCEVYAWRKVDLSNLQFVISLASAMDFPSGPEWSPPVLRDLWWLADHLGDDQNAQAIQMRWMASFRSLVRKGVLPPLDYARIKDRLSLVQHRPQPYSTNFTCAEGHARFYESVSPKELKKNRRQLGLFPMSVTSAYAEQSCAGE